MTPAGQLLVPAWASGSVTIVVTGLGVWSGAGVTADGLASRVLQGPGSVTLAEGGTAPTPVIRAPDPPLFGGFPQARRMDRSVHLALAAASQAHAEGRLASLDPSRIAILVGNSRGPAGKWGEPARTRIRPTQAANTAIASLSGALSIAFQILGPCLTLSAACASAAHAIAMGALLLRAGEADAVLAGGSEAPLTAPLLEQFHAAGLIGSHPDPALACRPFDRTRNGMVPGEGAAFVVLETAEHARARNQRPVAVLAGAAVGSEAHNRVAARADGAGLERVIRLAMERAAVLPEEIGYISAHGTGTRVNDAAEAAALDSVFGSTRPRPAVSSTKPVTGHAFGAAPALEAVLAIQALRQQLAPPTWSCLDPDPALSLDLVRSAPRPLSTRHVVSTSLGFWSQGAALVFRGID